MAAASTAASTAAHVVQRSNLVTPIKHGKVRTRILNQVETELGRERPRLRKLEDFRNEMGTHLDLWLLLFGLTKSQYRGKALRSGDTMRYFFQWRERGDEQVFYPPLYPHKTPLKSSVPPEFEGLTSRVDEPLPALPVLNKITLTHAERVSPGKYLPLEGQALANEIEQGKANRRREIQELHVSQPGDDYDYCECSVCSNETNLNTVKSMVDEAINNNHQKIPQDIYPT